MNKIIMIALAVAMALTASCSTLRGLGLSTEGKEGIQGILVYEVANTFIAAYCKRPAEKRAILTNQLKVLGIDTTNVKC